MLERVNRPASLVIPAIVVLFAALLVAVLPPGRAHACSCALQSFEEARERATAIFEGRVESIELMASAGEPAQRRVRFHVTQSWRGVEHESVEIRTAAHGAACGYGFEVGQHYLVYAEGEAQDLTVSACSRTARTADAREDRQLLGSGTIPVDVVDDTDEPQREPPATRAGCASCSVGRTSAPPALWALLAVGLAWLVGRRR
ncbi:MAG: hypothetical protein K1X94_16920 [Sandaracinaceae bacterium]|nr:hypothetical protein [Sandaracinaceae bacterium]